MAKSKYEYVKEWRKKNPGCRAREYQSRKARDPDKVKEIGRKAARKYIEANRDKVREASAEWHRNNRKNDPEAQRARVARFKAKREAERVAIAGRPRPSICDICRGNHHLGIVFDHCHATGKFRGWLCDRCNKVLGLVGDDEGLLENLKRYLNRHGKADVEIKGRTPQFGFCWTEQKLPHPG
jgi:hypothetical protein